ncbi:MAG: glycosyltransferase [Armatimonadetes bacterium]|nr:glycosyltransferase [Armatimonadota bacterium]
MDVRQKWEQFYSATPLEEVEARFHALPQSPFMLEYLETILRLCPQDGRTCEMGIGYGFNAIWLSQRGIRAEGVDKSPEIVERAGLVNSFLKGDARFLSGDLFHLYRSQPPRYHVIHHQGVLEHFTAPQIRAALAQQVALADWIVFSVPSVYYPYEPESGDERLLTLEVWREILAPFQREELRYYGDPQHGEREHILCVLKGQPVDEPLLRQMQALDFYEGITAIVHTRNEESRLEACLESLQGWTDQVLVCDMESGDRTLEIAKERGAEIVAHPLIPNFDRARNVSAMLARYRWIFYLDADERVPKALGQALRRIALTEGDNFEAVVPPFRHHFAGHWLRCLYPGYTAPRLFKNGRFYFNARLHSGAIVDGKSVHFPADNPDLALIHYSYDSVSHYIDKMNRYTDGEALNMHRDGREYRWTGALQEFVGDFHTYYDRMQACQDGVHGFIYSFFAGFYRFEQYAKLYERRDKESLLQPSEMQVPTTAEEVFSLALQMLEGMEREETLREGASPPNSRSTTPFAMRWEGAQLTWHSLAHVNRELCLALLKTGKAELSLLPTQPDTFVATEHPQFQPLAERYQAPLSRPAEIHVRHSFPPLLAPPPPEGHFVLIQAWEYGSLPKAWIPPILETVSEVWCYSETVRSLYRAAGIPEERLVLLPLGVDIELFHPKVPPYVFEKEAGAERFHKQKEERGQPFIFLFVGGTLWRKGIDILLTAYLNAFAPEDNVCLVIKDMGTETFYRGANHREKIQELLANTDPPAIVYTEEDIAPESLASLYATADCLVQPYRAAERRPLGGNRVDRWECVGETWMLEINPQDLARQMREVYENRTDAKRRGACARKRVEEGWTWDHAAEIVLKRLYALRELLPLAQRKPTPVPALPSPPAPAPESETPRRGGLRISRAFRVATPLISICMIVKNEERVLGDCLQSLRGWAGEVIVVDTGSTDNTVAIAERFGAKVYHFTWTNNFAEARNESLRHATGNWILWVDADDTVPPESAREILSAAQNAPPHIVGFVIPVQFVEDGTSHGGTRVDHVKLVRNVEGVCFEGRIHEQILPSLSRIGGEIARCNAVVLHSGYDTTPEGQARKRERDMTILHLELQERPDHPFVRFCLGMTHHYMGEHEEAILWLEKCLEVADPGDSIVRKAYALLAVSYREREETDRCLDTLNAGLAITPDDPELNFHLAHMLSSLQRYAEAKACYERVLCADISGYFTSVDKGILGYKTLHNLAGVCLLLDDYETAKAHWRKALESMPEFLPSAFELFQNALQREDFPAVQEAMEAVRQREGMSESWVTMGLQFVDKTGGAQEHEAFLLQCVQRDPEALAPRLHLARLLVRSERETEAETHLAFLNQRGVAEAAYYLGVSAIRRNDLRTALLWMEYALVLDPAHEPTKEQIANLKQALAAQERHEGGR